MKSDRGIGDKNAFGDCVLYYLRKNEGYWKLKRSVPSNKVDWQHAGSFATNYQRMSSAVFVIKKGEHVDVHLEQIFVQMDIIWRDWVREIVKMVVLKHFFFVKSRSKGITISFRKIVSFEKLQKRVAEAALVLV